MTIVGSRVERKKRRSLGAEVAQEPGAFGGVGELLGEKLMEMARGREYEAQHDGESKREKHLARNIQPGNDDGRD